jgi:hypothetical protein
MYWEMQTTLYKFFNSALYGDGWQNLQSNQITSEQNPEVPMDNMAAILSDATKE